MRLHKFIRVQSGNEIVVLELDHKRLTEASDETGTAKCPCCGVEIKPVFDITQMGFWDDTVIVLFACTSCYKAWWYSKVYSNIEIELTNTVLSSK